MHGFDVELNNEKFFFSILISTIYIKNENKHIEIPLSSLESIYVKDVYEKTIYHFLLKIQAKDIHVVGFTNSNIRDFYKGYLTYLIKEKITNNTMAEDVIKTYSIKNKEDEKKSLKIVKNIQMGREGIRSIESSKSAFMEFLISRPVLLCIFGELNCTLTQFHNYLKQSYFYDIKNHKNVIDRMLNEKIRDYSIVDDGFASRINTHSFLDINVQDVINDTDKKVSEEEVDFIPIYPKTDVGQRKRFSNFRFSDSIEIEFNYECKAEEFVQGISYDKNVLNELLILCQEAYNTPKGDIEGVRTIKQKSLKYQKFLNNGELQSFNPSNYFQP